MEERVDKVIKLILGHEYIDYENSFDIIKFCSQLMIDEETEYLARKIIIYALDNWDKWDAVVCEMWSELVEAIGFYPYIKKYKDKLKLNDITAQIRTEYYESDNMEGKYLHEEQKKVLNLLEGDKNIILSAPTSFGKSLLIEEIVASRRYNNIVIIQPTIALLDETRKKLNKYNNFYKIIVKTTQKASLEKGNLFLLTAERVMEYEDFKEIQLVILDEFYKISNKRDDERSDVLNNAFNNLLTNFKCRFYLLGPNIDGISKDFAEKYNAVFYKTDYSLVENKGIDYYQQYNGLFGDKGKAKEYKEEKLFELLCDLSDEQTIIYCSSPGKVRRLSKRFKEYLKKRNIYKEKQSFSLTTWVEKNISSHWSLIECLEYKIGIHDGALQKHITASIIDYFNKQELNYLFCTSTIIEGVNTSAKNVVYFDHTKGGGEIDYFDYCNIKGRSGRMMEHFIGKVYNFNPVPLKENIIIDIPFFEQNPISDEVLINIDEAQVKEHNKERYNELHNLYPEIKKIFQKNGVSINGQKKILDTLMQDIKENSNLINWSGYPNYKQLGYVVKLAWDNLVQNEQSVKPMTCNRLIKVTFDYGNDKNIMKLVQSSYNFKKSKTPNKSQQDILDEAIQEAFQILKHWFEYKLPKWLNVINSIQQYICKINNIPQGNYTFYAKQIENDFIRDNLSILIECGIPRSAINKIAPYIPEDIGEDYVQNYIIQYDIITRVETLIEYEVEKLKELL